MNQSLLKPKERLDDLQCNGLQIIQDPSAFCFGMDAVLLAHFARIRQHDTVVDLCTGCGVIPLLLTAYSQAEKIIGFDIQESMIDMARRSAELNHVSDRVRFEMMDVRQNSLIEIADYVTCNPPYYKASATIHSKQQAQALARYEIEGTLSDFVYCAAKMVKAGGRVAFIHRSERILELSDLFRQNHLEPKRMQFIQTTMQKAPHLVLLEGRKLAKAGLQILPVQIFSESLEHNS